MSRVVKQGILFVFVQVLGERSARRFADLSGKREATGDDLHSCHAHGFFRGFGRRFPQQVSGEKINLNFL